MPEWLPSLAPGHPPPGFATLLGRNLAFQQLSAEDRRLPALPRFLFGDVGADTFFQHGIMGNLHACGVYRAAKVAVFGDCVLSREGLAYRFPEIALHPAHIEAMLAPLRRAPPLQRRELMGPHVLLVGAGLHVYGHWLVDFLPKLALLRAAGFRLGQQRFLLPKDTPTFARRLLQVLGVGPRQIVEFNPLHEWLDADDLIIPTHLHNGLRASPLLRDAAALFADRLERRHGPLAGGGTPARLFVTRAGVNQGRNLLNRQRIEQMATTAGFAVVAPETLPVLRQIKLFAGAREIIGEYGSALHGTLFSPSGTIVCGLRGNSVQPGFVQSAIGEALGQPTGYVYGPLTFQHPDNPLRFDFQIPEPVFSTCLATVFGSQSL